ncbi:hypothetical protein [Aliidiomarina quisquiliarum]|uniref:hypothetical protein n=1 Tax=Aliidiomarina quisquiliarum TaxID=2938947 RepID=UPI00208FE54C|nr:hypothetical protein [Aliidiomarina quisquiliarum]MCO4321334.1 hypothetical protein [Aliidiomarina quisquiliarum]
MSRNTHIVYLVIILALAGWFMLTKQQPHMRASSSAPAAQERPQIINSERAERPAMNLAPAEQNESVAQLLVQVQELEQDNTRLLALVDRLEQQLTTSQHQPLNEQGRNAIQFDQMSQEQLNALFKSAPPGVLTAEEVELRLATEPADDEWAYNLDILVQDLMLTHNELRNLKLENVKCTTSLCAIDLSSYDKNKNFDMMGFHQVISNAGVVNNQTHNSLIMLNSDDNSVQWVISLKEEGGH